jgi:hypothetical protein
VGRLTFRLAERFNSAAGDPAQAGFFAAACYLAVPGTIITASLAFTEQALLAFGASALLLAFESSGECLFRRGLAIGLLCGWAALCKLTALALLGLPVAAIFIILSGKQDPRGRFWPAAITAGGAFALGFLSACLPWCLRNFLWTGNPAFPLATEIFGRGNLSAEQIQLITRIHLEPYKTIGERFWRLWRHGLASLNFGFLLIPAALVSAWLCLRRVALRLPVLLLLGAAIFQITVWMVSLPQLWRYLIPLLLPICLLAGLLAAVVPRRWAQACLIALLCWLAGLDYRMYFTESGTPVAGIDGVEFMAHEQEPYRTLNSLPPGSRVYAEVFATPFYVLSPLDYHSFLDLSPLGAALQRGGQKEALLWLRRSGYTHVVIDWGMLTTWTSPGDHGYDQNITVPSLRAFAAAALKPIFEGAHSGISVYALR